jgi:hypothetical protein
LNRQLNPLGLLFSHPISRIVGSPAIAGDCPWKESNFFTRSGGLI